MSLDLDELSRRTDALTFLNALKVTLTQLKQEVAAQDELREYMNESGERIKKLVKKYDATYRMFARLVTKESPYATDVTIDETLPANLDELKEVMESE